MTEIEQTDAKTLRKAIAGSAGGNATEWYDCGVHAYVATESTHGAEIPGTPESEAEIREMEAENA